MTFPGTEFLGIAICLVLSAFFSSAETALTSLGRARIDKMMNENPSHAKPLQLWLDRPREVLTTILIGNNITNTLGAALATVAAEKMLQGVDSNIPGLQPVPLAVGMMTFLLLTFGEISPKVLARTYREVFAPRAMMVLRPLHFLIRPLVWVFVQLTKGIMRLLGQSNIERNHISDEEIEFLVNLGSEEGSISEDKLDLFESVFEVTETTAREIMVPRLDVVTVPVDIEREALLRTILDAGHSRMPVYEGGRDEIIGIVHVKDVFGALHAPHPNPEFRLRELLRDAYFVPESKSILPLLREMQSHRNHMSVVVDEFGGTSGIVTLEDIIEEFFGEIWDEHDRRTDAGIRMIGEKSFYVNARVPLYDLEELFGMKLPEDGDYDTVSGFIAKETGTVAPVGTLVERWGLRFTVVESDRRRVRKIRVDWIGDESDLLPNGEQDEASDRSS